MEPDDNTLNWGDVFQLMQSRIGEILVKQMDLSATANVINALLDAIRNIALVETELSMQVSREATPVFLETLKQAMQVLGESLQTEDSIEIPNATLESFQELAPLVPADKREEFEQFTTPKKERKILTTENVKWLLGIIIPILFSLYLRQLPDKNAEEDLMLYREEIAIESREDELLEEEIELFREFFDYLKENGISFPESTDTIKEDISAIEENVDTLNDPALSDFQTDDLSDQPTDQDGQK